MPDPKALFKRAAELHRSGRLKEAIELYRYLLDIFGINWQILFSIGSAECEAGNTVDGIRYLDRSLALNPRNAFAYNNKGSALHREGNIQGALESYDAAVSQDHEYAVGYFNRGSLLAQIGRLEDGLADLNRAVTLRSDYADARFMRAEVLLLLGRFDEGWQEYEWRWQSRYRGSKPPYGEIQDWSGAESLNGKALLLLPEVGYGDLIMFVRYVPLLRQVGAKVLLLTPPPLVTLLSASLDAMVVTEGSTALHDADYKCPIMSLPRVLGTTTRTIPSSVPYLKIGASDESRWRAKLGERRNIRVGLCWSGRRDRDIDDIALQRRAVPLALLEPLMKIPVEFHSLQKEVPDSDIDALSRFGSLVMWQDELRDFSDTAALIGQMDLVVSIDTSVAHLAGALGRPLWVMLPFSTDYRWGLWNETTPWYPTAKLFRQREMGAWTGVAEDLADALISFLNASALQTAAETPERSA